MIASAEPRRILVAMSGGVDSSVAAALLHEQGHEVLGVTMHLWDATGEHQVGRCCAPEDRDDARRTCEHLGIPHYVIDEREAFRAEVVEPFLAEYESGRTPIPCVQCNRTVKLHRLAVLADRFNCSHIATGHYARIAMEAGEVQLLRGRDRAKDQTYFLFGVRKDVLARLIFPLGEMVKDEARAEGRRLGVPNADKPDSQELCFVPDGDISGFVRRELGATKPGRVVDESGAKLADHDGVSGFTVGQRKGLGLGGGPVRFVLKILDQGDVVVGGDDALYQQELLASGVQWLRRPTGPIDASIRIRHRHGPEAARIEPTESGFRAVFTEPQRAITPGQAAVVYLGDEVLGGGFIDQL